MRLIGVSLSSLSVDHHQLPLFGRERTEKWERALESVDDVRRRHGFEYLRFGKSMRLGRSVRLSTPSLSR